MKTALAQMDVLAGRPKNNVKKMLSMIDQAKDQGANIVAFPELSVTGYMVGDKFLDPAFCRNAMEFNEPLREASKGITLIYGNLFFDENINDRVHDDHWHPNKDGRTRMYNAAYIFQDRQTVRRKNPSIILPKEAQPKTLLPNYRFFNEEKYFFSLVKQAEDFGVDLESLLSPFLATIDNKEIPLGLQICEDLWCEDYRRNGQALNTAKILVENGAEYIFNLSASPWTVGKNETRDERIKFIKDDIGNGFVPFFYVNNVGAQNNVDNIVTFDGSTTFYNRNAEPVVIAEKPYLEQMVMVNDGDLGGEPLTRKEKPKIGQKLDAIVRGVQHLKDVMGLKEYPRMVIGLSGGIDSALVTAISTLAVGPHKVLGINIPSGINKKENIEVAEYVSNALEIGYESISIEDLIDANVAAVDSIDPMGDNRKLSDFNLGNLQAKLRSPAILSNIAAKYHAVYTCNGNKVELGANYFTLDGDGRGGIAPINDLTKTEVVEMCKYINAEVFGKEVIPEILFPDELWRFGPDKVAPMAELEKGDKVDPMKFGYHCALIEQMTDFKIKTPEDMMKSYQEGTLHEQLGIPVELMDRYGLLDPDIFMEDLEWFDRNVVRGVFKRGQSPPIIITSKTAYGRDREEAMLPYETTLEYDRLKQQIKEMKSYSPKEQLLAAV